MLRAKSFCGAGLAVVALTALIALSVAPNPADAQRRTLSANELLVTGFQSIEQSDPVTALKIAEALLTRDATHSPALQLKSAALRALGRPKDAIPVARSAWRYAKSDHEKYGAALITAQALSSAGYRTRAQFWLRRANQAAPNEQARRIAARDFNYVRNRNPWATELTFNVAPSNNINNGSANATSQLFGLPIEFDLSGDARALSGYEISGGISTRYRLSQTNLQRHDLVFALHHKTFQLSAEAKRQAPSAKGSDFAYSTLTVGYQFAGRRPNTGLQNSFALSATHHRYGGKSYYNALRASTGVRYAVSSTSRVFANAALEGHFSTSGRENSKIWSTSLGVDHVLANRDRVTLSINGTRALSPDVNQDYRRAGINLDYSLNRQIAGMQFSFGLSASKRDSDASTLVPGGRHDRTVSANITATLTNIEYYGFVPSITLSASKTDANLALFERNNFGIQFGIVSKL